jgi:RNAse (barnase) inhibitor barstar
LKNLFFRFPKEEDKEMFFNIISKRFKIDIELLNVLYSYFGDNIWLIFSLFEGQKINFPYMSEFKDITTMLDIYKEIKKMLEYGMDFTKAIDILAEKYSMTSNKIFVYYNKILHLVKNTDEYFF